MHNANDVGVNAQIINNTIKEIKGNKKITIYKHINENLFYYIMSYF